MGEQGRRGGEGLRKDKEREEDKEGERTTAWRDRERPVGKTRREERTREEGKPTERKIERDT